MDRPDLSACVVICTRDRPGLLEQTLRAMDRQTDRDFTVLVVAQGQPVDAVVRRVASSIPVRIVHDSGTGVSRARNLGWRQAGATWIVYVDDDCRLEPDWIAAFRATAKRHPDCSYIRGEVLATGQMPRPYLPVAVMTADRERVMRGRWRAPLKIGHHVCMALRRDVIAAVGGWDERLGHGSSEFPGAADVDFNHRLLVAGAAACVTPALRAHHEQWRTSGELVPLFHGYMIGRGAVAAKHLKAGSRRGGLWLLALLSRDCTVLLASALAFRSKLRLEIGLASWRGMLIGLRRGWRTTW